MAERVVDLFEVVDVDHEHAVPAGVALPLEEQLRLLEERPPIGDAGQRVDVGQRLQPGHEPAVLGDRAHLADEDDGGDGSGADDQQEDVGQDDGQVRQPGQGAVGPLPFGDGEPAGPGLRLGGQEEQAPRRQPEGVGKAPGVGAGEVEVGVGDIGHHQRCDAADEEAE